MTAAGVLLMAYGTPRSPEEVQAYLTEVRGGRQPSPQAVEDLRRRYLLIGGTSPLLEITRRQAEALRGATRLRTYMGMKHWHPYIHEAAGQAATDGVEVLVAIALAPHYSRMSIGGYESRLLRARDALGAGFEVRMIPRWYDHPGFVAFQADGVRAALSDWDPADPALRVFFTAHSLPERILAEGDPYLDELLDSARLVASAAGVPFWELAFQSASATNEPWLGPDVLQRLEAFAASGGRRALVAPIGFVADHLEILYDIDIVCAQRAERLGIALRRTPSPNDHPRLVEVLADLVHRRLAW